MFAKYLYGSCCYILVAAAQTSTNRTQLDIVSSMLDAKSQTLTVTFANRSTKTIVAYVVQIRQSDASGKDIGSPLTIGTE